MARSSLAVLGVALMLLSIACGSAEPSRQTAVPTRAQETLGLSTLDSRYAAAASAITLFHLRLDQRNYSGIYAMTDETFRAVSSEAQLTARLTSLRDRLGRSTSVDELSSEYVDLTPDVQLSFVIETTFENGTLIETFVWRVTSSEKVYLVSFQTR
jgi:hypothetical protein